MEGFICERIKASTSPGIDRQKPRPPSVVRKQRLPRDERSRIKALVRVGTLIIGTLNGKTREIADFMQRRTIRILCLQETRWKGCKAIDMGDYIKLFYYGVETRRNRVAKAMDASLKDYISFVTRVSDRTISLRIAASKGFWTVVSVCQCICTEIEKATFYEELNDVIRKETYMVMLVRTEEDVEECMQEEALEGVIRMGRELS
ncbi:hypothetical protein Y032_0024g1019 [Ancylostoma ceylanicum]|uniref:Endonuclease/exonuclease/phosphatase domain-containing protein n=1 Tax=Ancylostoma ceylanicum TaxID=53326 RepID=A0A016UVT0_9BILA|nr:hypothetical protein Y032_0024g1019 [Ancylostoma ceylanicum]